MNPFTEVAKQSRESTNKALAGKIAPLVSFTGKKVERLLPEKRDKEEFVKLMEKVEDETDMDEKLAYLETNVKTVGKVIIQVLRGLT